MEIKLYYFGNVEIFMKIFNSERNEKRERFESEEHHRRVHVRFT